MTGLPDNFVRDPDAGRGGESAPSPTATGSRRKLIIKALLLFVFAVCALLVLSSPELREYFSNIGRLRDRLQEFGTAAPLLFVLMAAALVGLGMPRLLICPVGGLMFGFWWGLVLSLLGTVVGSYAVFVFVRWGGREMVLRKWPKLRRATAIFERRGFVPVFLARLLPAGGLLINAMLALTPTRHFSFLVGTFLGFLPEAIPATLLGASGAAAVGGENGYWKFLLAVLGLILVWLILAELVRRSSLGRGFLRRLRETLGSGGMAP